MEIIIVWFQFILLGVLIAFAGFKLSYLADQISEKTNLGRNLVGIIMLSTVTSLPELVTGISSVSISLNPNLALGDVIGSSCFNLLIVVVLDLFYRKGSVYSRSTQGHIFTALMGIILIGFVGLSLTLKHQSWFQIGHVGVSSFIIPLLYVVALKAIYNLDRPAKIELPANRSGLARDFIFFAIYSTLIVLSGSFLPHTAEKIAYLMGWNSAFMGTVFVALVTSFPELSVTLGALRINAAELAFSNLLGSNIFNIVILAVDDIFYTKGALFTDVSDVHTSTVFSALMMTGLVMVALMKPPQKKVFNIISGLSVLLLGVYTVTIMILYNG